MEVTTQGASSAPVAAAAEPTADQAPAPTINQGSPEDRAAKEDLDFSSRFAALTRKERAILQREREIKSMREAPDWKEFETFKQLKADPRRNAMKVVESLGVPLSEFYQDLTGLVLNDGKPSVEQELQALRAQYESDRKAQEEERAANAARSKQQADARVTNQYRSMIAEEADKNPEAYELARAFSDEGSLDLGLQVAEAYWQKTGKILSPKQVCEAVEKHYEQRAEKLKTLKKLGYAPPAPVEEALPPPDKQLAPQRTLPQTPRTLTNSAASMSSQQVSAEDRSLMNPERRRAWTAAKLKEVWKK